MEDVLKAQANFRRSRGLQKVMAIPNRTYQSNGTKSYVWALNRFGFQPTKPGPYFQKYTESGEPTGKTAPGVKPGHVLEGLFNKVEGSEEPGEVRAEDQQTNPEYLCPVSIGTKPSQKVLVGFDTGSSDLWVNIHKNFNPKKSPSFKTCADATWKIQRGDGSSASGTVGYDVLSLGGLAIKEQAIQLAEHLSPQFTDGTMDGILGLAFRKRNTIHWKGNPFPHDTPFENVMRQEDIPVEAGVFTCAMYSTRDPDPAAPKSFYTFGWIDRDLASGGPEGEEKGIHWAPLDESTGLWMFASETATVNGTTTIVSRPGNRAVADTGTALILLSDQVCDALYAQIRGAEYAERHQGWVVQRGIAPDELPDFRVAVGGREFVVQKQDLVFAPVGGEEGEEEEEGGGRWWYGAVQSRGECPFDVLGDAFLRSVYAIWDKGNMRFGAVPKVAKTQNVELNAMPLVAPELEKDVERIFVKSSYGDISGIAD